jgi:hypothetical protein
VWWTVTSFDPVPETLDARTPCKYHPFGHSDVAKRAADNINVHVAAMTTGGVGWDAIGKWVALRLSDGGSDQTLYDTKSDAVRHQSDEFLCVYVRLRKAWYDACEMEIFMEVNRRAYDAGFRLADPDARSGGRQILLSDRVEERRRILDILRNARSGN